MCARVYVYVCVCVCVSACVCVCVLVMWEGTRVVLGRTVTNAPLPPSAPSPPGPPLRRGSGTCQPSRKAPLPRAASPPPAPPLLANVRPEPSTVSESSRTAAISWSALVCRHPLRPLLSAWSHIPTHTHTHTHTVTQTPSLRRLTAADLRETNDDTTHQCYLPRRHSVEAPFGMESAWWVGRLLKGCFPMSIRGVLALAAGKIICA